MAHLTVDNYNLVQTNSKRANNTYLLITELILIYNQMTSPTQAYAYVAIMYK